MQTTEMNKKFSDLKKKKTKLIFFIFFIRRKEKNIDHQIQCLYFSLI